MGTEAFCWILLGISVLIFISLLGLGGKAGSALGSIFFGLMGMNAYVFPFMLFFFTIFVMVNRGNRRAYIQTAAAAGLFVVVCGLMELMAEQWHGRYALADYYEVGAQYHQGGGVIGGALAILFCPTIGLAGAVIVLVMAAFLFLALLTQKTLFVNAGRKGKAALDEKRETSRVKREEDRARRQEEQELKRARQRREREEQDRIRKEKLSLLDQKEEEKKAKKQKSSPDLTVTTDLFGEPKVRGGAGKRGANGGKGKVIFGKLQGDVPDEENAPDTSFSGKKDKKVVSSGNFRDVPAPSSDEDTDDELFRKAFPPLKEAVSDEKPQEAVSPAALSPDFEIHREGSGADSKREAPDQDDDLPEDGAIVTARQIREAGVSEARKKTAPSDSPKSVCRSMKPTAQDADQAAENVAKEIEQKQEEIQKPYTFPPLELLKKPGRNGDSTSDEDLRRTASKLQQILATFGVSAKVTNVSCGPSVTRYELQPEMGTKVSKITNLADDIKMNLAVTDIRIEAPIPGKAAVGIEVPNKSPSMVSLRELIDSDEFRKVHNKKLSYVVGKDIAGKIVVSDIAKMPHLLIAGATGSGKSVFINTMIMSIIYNADPAEVKMIMIDPKVVELSVYNGIPHLYIPVVTDPKKAAGALNWAVAEMTRRYQMFAQVGVRNLAGYNAKAESLIEADVPDAPKKLPQIVIIVDELADLMMVSGNEVEDAICRLAQLARACGIHLVIATQRPSVDVITGLIKANIPSRIAFAVSSGTDSRTILDRNGAERLLGNGDMLFSPQNYKNPVRIQGGYVSDEEIQEVVDSIKQDQDPEKVKAIQEEVQKMASTVGTSSGGGGDVDELFADAGRFIISKDKASIGMLQRWLKIGFNRAARIMDQLSDAGVVGPDEGTKPRKVLMSEEQFENYLEQN